MKIAHHTWYAWWPGRLIIHKPIWSVLDFLPPFEGHHHQIWVENLWREFCCKSFTVVNSGSSNSLEWDIREYWGFGLWVIIILPVCASSHLLECDLQGFEKVFAVKFPPQAIAAKRHIHLRNSVSDFLGVYV